MKYAKKITFILALLLCMAAAFAVCMNKQGMHEDEYYSYYSTNRTDGLWLDRNVSRETVLNELRVLDGEGFDFALVKEVQSWDVHPPLYYFLLHLVCSFMPGVFSMWQGLGINLACFLIALILMKWLGTLLVSKMADNEDDKLSPLWDYAVTAVVMVWGLSAAALTGVVFIRMYMMLTVLILAVTILHVIRPRPAVFYPVLGVITFAGFMTHYYFFIWLFFLAVFCNLYELITTRKWKGILIYALTMVAAFGLSYLFYPAWPAQMFKGQRGAQATGTFFDLSNTWQRICFFADKVNVIGFGGILFLLVIIAAALVIAVRRVKPVYVILAASLIMYFLVISKTALMLGDSSIRYQMPVIGIAYLVIFMVIGQALHELVKREKFGERTSLYCSLFMSFMLALLLVCNIMADANGRISFLYEDVTQHKQILSEYPEAQPVYVYASGQDWCVWGAMDELLTYDFVRYIPEDELADLTDESGQMIVFADNALDNEEIIDGLCGNETAYDTAELLYEDEYCNVYLVE